MISLKQFKKARKKLGTCFSITRTLEAHGMSHKAAFHAYTLILDDVGNRNLELMKTKDVYVYIIHFLEQWRDFRVNQLEQVYNK